MNDEDWMVLEDRQPKNSQRNKIAIKDLLTLDLQFLVSWIKYIVIVLP